MNEAGGQQLCPRCSVPGGQQHHMNRRYINFTEQVDMCSNPKCLWIQLVSADSVADSQTQLPGGLTTMLGSGGGGDQFDQLLSSLCDPSVDSGVDADGSERSLSSWETAPSDASSLCSELAGVGLSSAASEAGGGRWRPASAPTGPRSSAGSSLATDTCSEPDPAALRRAARRARLADPRPQSGLSLRAFSNGEVRQRQPPTKRTQPSQTRSRKRSSRKGLYPSPAGAAGSETVFRRPSLPPWERAGLRHSLTGDSWELLFGWDPAARRRHRQSAIKKLEQAERLEKEATAAAKAAANRGPAAASASVVTGAVGSSPASCSTTNTGCSPAAAAPATPRPQPTRRAHPPPARHDRPRPYSESEVAAQMDSMLTSRLRSTLNADQVFVRERQVERVRAWARKKTGAGAL